MVRHIEGMSGAVHGFEAQPAQKPEQELETQVPQTETENVPSELKEQDLESVELPAQETVPSTEDAEIGHVVQEQAIGVGFMAMREVLRGIDDYVVFGSGAAYLFGRKNDIPELGQQIPRDIDVAVRNEETLHHIHQRLANLDGVTFENEGKYKRLGEDDVKVLAGEVKVGIEQDGEIVAIRVPFEVFQNSRLLPPDVVQHTTDAAGLRILNEEGLEKQVYNNLKFESRVGRGVEEVVEFLTNESIEDQLREELAEMRRKQEIGEPYEMSKMMRIALSNLKKEEEPNLGSRGLDLTPDNLEDFYRMADEQRAEVVAEKVEGQYGKLVELIDPEVEADLRQKLDQMSAAADAGENIVIPPEMKLILESNRMSLEQLEEFYRIVDRMREEGEVDIKSLSIESAGVLTGGLKMKIGKRKRDLETIRKIRRQDFKTTQKDEPGELAA